MLISELDDNKIWYDLWALQHITLVEFKLIGV